VKDCDMWLDEEIKLSFQQNLLCRWKVIAFVKVNGKDVVSMKMK